MNIWNRDWCLVVFSVCWCIHPCMNVWRSEVNVECLPLFFFPPKFLRQGLSLKLELTDWLAWLSSESISWILQPLPLNTGITVTQMVLSGKLGYKLNSPFLCYISVPRQIILKCEKFILQNMWNIYNQPTQSWHGRSTGKLTFLKLSKLITYSSFTMLNVLSEASRILVKYDHN